MTEFDPVKKAKHYNLDPSGIECIDVVRHRNFNIGSAFKYLWRQGLKEESNMDLVDKQIQDMDKAIYYIEDEKKRILEMVELEKAKLGQASSNFCNVCRTEGKFVSIPTNDLTCIKHDGKELCIYCKEPVYIGQNWDLNNYNQVSHIHCLAKQRGYVKHGN